MPDLKFNSSCVQGASVITNVSEENVELPCPKNLKLYV